MKLSQVKSAIKETIREKFKQSLTEASYNLGSEQYTKRNMTPVQILDLAMAYAKVPGKGNPMYGKKMQKMIVVANDLARLNGTIQQDHRIRTKEPALILSLLKNKLVSKEEYVELYNNLLQKQISVIAALKNADPASRIVGGAAARQAHKDMKGEFEESVNEVKYPTDLKIGSVIKGQGFTRLKGIDGGKYYKIVDMDDTTATLTRTDPSGKVSSPTKVRHKLDSIEAGIKTAKRGDENGIVVIKESVNESLKHLIHVETPKEILSKDVAKQIMTLAKKGVRSSEIGLNMGFIGNNTAAVNSFQKVKNQIYFSLDKRNESVNEAFQKGKTYGGTKCEGGCFIGKQGLMKIIKISKENPTDVFIFRDDNYSGLQPHFIKNGVIAKANTIGNPSYDLEKHKINNLKIGNDVILSVRIFV
jgi:hypothetical protein